MVGLARSRLDGCLTSRRTERVASPSLILRTNMIETELTRALGIRVPVVQGGMMWVGRAELAAAVSEAGGLGIITGLSPGSPDKLRDEIRKARKLTSKPFAVNLTFLPSISPPPYEQYAQVIIDEGVKIAETAGGPAAIPIIKMFKKAGIYVIHKCTAIRHALRHPGEDDIGGLVLLALAARHLKVPFIASGGIADGRGLAAALALGAQGVNCGTLFMATKESYVHERVKDQIVKASERDTVHIFRTLNNTARVFKNKPAMEAVRREREALQKTGKPVNFAELAPIVSGAKGKLVYDDGDLDAGVWSASPVIGLINDVPSCKELIDRLERDAEAIISENAARIKRSSKL